MFLQKSYFEVNFGALYYPFGEKQMQQGYTLDNVRHTTATGIRLALGYNFNNYWAAQISYLCHLVLPNVYYNAITAADSAKIGGNVANNIVGITMKGKLPIGKKWSVFGEAGMSIITRSGVPQMVKNANFVTLQVGAGVKYQITPRWGIQLSGNYTPPSPKHNHQPSTTFAGIGVTITPQPFSNEYLQKSAATGIIHPKQWIQIGYTTNLLDYDVNEFLINEDGGFPYVSFIWNAAPRIKQGFTLNYQRNVFHSQKWFALDWGANVSVWQSLGRYANPSVNDETPQKFVTGKQKTFFTISIFPVFRLNYLHTKWADMYAYYCVAGPTFISTTKMDGYDLGKKFLFVDNIGTGAFFGNRRQYNIELKIGHYSNGDIFTDNKGITVPLSLNVGYAF
ncbi:hypothetical protein AGMMS4956_03320 [Bacteroidia bacterium]|nr:hypothetical protein AGMMS4956_03320 [Bacteroidia bacterium]